MQFATQYDARDRVFSNPGDIFISPMPVTMMKKAVSSWRSPVVKISMTRFRAMPKAVISTSL